MVGWSTTRVLSSYSIEMSWSKEKTTPKSRLANSLSFFKQSLKTSLRV